MMRAMDTASDVYRTRPPRGEPAPRLALHVLGVAGDLAIPASIHALDDVDAIVFGRGKRSWHRDRADGLRRLVARIPDPIMSADHGRLLRVHGTWMLDDPRSKNGATIAGRPTRCARVAPGDVIELGHTLLVIDALGDASAPDRIAKPVRSSLDSLFPPLAAAAGELARVAASDIPVLFHGETGTGKEVYARALHERSGRPGPLIAVNCGALPPSLIEAELFGHRKGAFSGAIADRIGFVRSADRGTLLLDEIHELPPAGQVALLRVLQEREVVPVGDERAIAVDVRVCTASPRRLADEVDGGRFRSDLFARLLGYELALPPLRDRRIDLVGLCRAVAPGVRISPAALRGLVCHDWPRNIRELERVLATARVVADGAPIELAHLPDAIRASAARGTIAVGPAPIAALAPEVPPAELSERDELARKLVDHRGNVSAVARDLGKHREQVQRCIRRYGLDLASFRR